MILINLLALHFTDSWVLFVSDHKDLAWNLYWVNFDSFYILVIVDKSVVFDLIDWESVSFEFLFLQEVSVSQINVLQSVEYLFFCWGVSKGHNDINMIGIIFLHKVSIIDKDVIIFDSIYRSVNREVFEFPPLFTINGLVRINLKHIVWSGLTVFNLFGLTHEEPIFEVNIIVSCGHYLNSRLLIILINILFKLH